MKFTWNLHVWNIWKHERENVILKELSDEYQIKVREIVNTYERIQDV